jgi:23S rRNA (cytidine1920-2'-O)/16S rRNA (cytidine1409-2'-O)-methyltransferase
MPQEEKRIRLDKILVLRKLVPSRARALALIKEKKVSVGGVVITKQDATVSQNDEIVLLGKDIPWVSRAGLKLVHELDHWRIITKGKVVLDIGASTGGFTDVLLSHGAKKVYALDVGHNQLAKKLLESKQVVNMEGVHIKDVTKKDFKEPLDIVVIDVSFISLEKVLPKAFELLRKSGTLVALIKPQFEVGKEKIKKGIVTDPKLHASVAMQIEAFAASVGFTVEGILASPILGSDGNKEFFLYAQFL